MDGLDNAQRLKKLKRPLYSIQRRNERFKIMYIYKLKEGLLPNILNKIRLTFSVHGGHGCKCDKPTFFIRGKEKNARDSSFNWAAYNMWNSHPMFV